MTQEAKSISLAWEESPERLRITLPATAFALEVVQGAAYSLVNKWYVFLSPVDESDALCIELMPKDPEQSAQDGAQSLVQALADGLTQHHVLGEIAAATKEIREYVVARAFFEPESRVDIDALLADLDAEDDGDDPLNIAVPWEDRYEEHKAQRGGEAAEAPEDAADAGDAGGESPEPSTDG